MSVGREPNNPSFSCFLDKVIWYPEMDQTVCLNMVKKDQLWAIALKRKFKNFKSFTENGYYGNQPQPFECFTAVDADSSC